MNTLQRYMVLNSLLLVVIPVMSQQKKDKEIKLNEETVKLIQFDFLPGDMENYNKPLEAPLEKKWMEYKNPFDEDCEKNYNLHTTCPTPKISTGEIHVTNELTCQKKCICPTSYQYHTRNCSGSKAPTGASSNDTKAAG